MRRNKKYKFPLQGKTVVVTRPLVQSDSLKSLLEKKGARVLLCPAIKTEFIANSPEIKSVLKTLRQDSQAYDWILFFSENGVRSFAKLVGSISFRARIAVVGPHTAHVVRSLGWKVAKVAKDSSRAGLVKFLNPQKGERCLIPSVSSGKKSGKLFSAGVEEIHLETYRTVSALPPSKKLKKKILTGVDAVTFTSGSTVRNFLNFFSKKEKMHIFLNSLSLSIGASTTQVLKSMGITNIVQSRKSTPESMVEDLCQTYSR